MSDTKNYSAENNYDQFLNRSLYYSIYSLNNSLKYHKKKIDNLFIMHFNIRSLQRNFDQMHKFLSKLSVLPDIIAFTETRLSGNSAHSNIELNGYDFLHVDSETLAGGVGLLYPEQPRLHCKYRNQL